MVSFIVKRNGNTSEIRFPCVEKDIRRVQCDLQIPYPSDTRVTVLGVDSDIEQFSVLEGQQTDLDFLNLLGRMMYGLDEREYKQFQIGLYHESAMDLKGIINVLADVHRYSIIDLNDMEKSGLEHEFDVRGGIPTDEIKNTDYSPVAQKLIDSGKCRNTPYGILYVNEEMPVPDFFDGQHMPAYYDRDFQIACTLRNDCDTDFVFLPCSDEELQRSARRLNTSFPYDLSVTIDDTSFRNDEAMRWIRDEDVFTLNRYAQLLDGLDDEETDRFLSAVDFANQYLGGVNDLQTAVKIGTSLHAFTLYPNVMCDEDLGATLLGEYDVPEELWEFIDKERLGKHFRENESGRYTDKGYVGVNDWSAIRQYLKPKEGMGGIE